MRSPAMSFVFFIFTLSACHRKYPDCKTWLLKKVDDRLTIVNSTPDKIAFMLSYDYPDDTLRLADYVPDELLIDHNPDMNVGPTGKQEVSHRECWEYTFDSRIKSGKLHILIFNVDTVKAYSPAEIISKGLYKSYLYTLEDLKELDWQAVYP